MLKTIKIDDNHEFTISNNISWAMEYREQFGHDIVPDLLPVASALITLLGEINANQFDIAKMDKDLLQDALINLAGVQFVDFINLIWAMTKAADDKTPEPKKWLKQFEAFPLDIIAPQVFNHLLEGMVSQKNLMSLRPSEANKK